MPSLNDLDISFMQQALTLARAAPLIGEVPIAALLVHDGTVIAHAHNLRETRQDPTAHAEVLVIQDAARRTGSWRLIDTTLYVTLEPCTMCIGAIVLARIPRLVFAATDPKAGACGSIMNIPPEPQLNHRVEVIGGVCAEESQTLLQEFFRQLRKDAARRETA
ncbi:MAG: tRNA adenosine(34) deaminase TadA [Nitrospira sp.]|nr:tRNA adenosine(34) deaminase TadA [Nitrospira sp.]MBP6604626.1 tRNA adenosine(34) deaminase TadA [Nitrospira sp.]HQY57779.1 tRNA adenosine(34) deaminase TadA [Nitrospira sp.]HRA96619.1 tRNA adenosine(34) deaminase TadA [Nitrospira sp.]